MILYRFSLTYTERERDLLSLNVPYSIVLPATNLLILFDTLRSHTSSAFRQKNEAPREFRAESQENIEKESSNFSHKSSVSLIIVSCCDQRDHVCASSKRLMPVSFLNSIRNNNLPAAISSVYLLLFFFHSFDCFVRLATHNRYSDYSYSACLCQFDFVRSFTFERNSREKRIFVINIFIVFIVEKKRIGIFFHRFVQSRYFHQKIASIWMREIFRK